MKQEDFKKLQKEGKIEELKEEKMPDEDGDFQKDFLDNEREDFQVFLSIIRRIKQPVSSAHTKVPQTVLDNSALFLC